MSRRFKGLADGSPEQLAQLGLEHLAGGTDRDGIHKHHVIGDLPLGCLAFVEREQFLASLRCLGA